MSEELGKIEKPKAEGFKKGRKLYFVPLVFSPPEADEKFQGIFNRYWDEALSHLKALQEKLAPAKKIYHELVAEAGENGPKTIERLNSGSFHIVKDSLGRGAEIIAVEDAELLGEFMDWGRCLATGLRSKAVFTLAYESYIKTQEKRNEFIVRQIDKTLGSEEAGILIMREGHHLQFPGDIQVFYVSPPALDEIRRWERGLEEETARQNELEKEE